MYESFNVGFEIKSVFLDVSKTFDEVAGLYHLQTNSKWNIEEYTKPFAGFFFLKERKVFTWGNINTGVHQGSILGSLLFFIYISDPKEGLTINAKLLAIDISLFSVVHDTQTSANDLNKDLEIINNWAFQWEMNFNHPNPTKEAHEIIFSCKAKEIYHPQLVLNNISVSQSSSPKHLGGILDSKLVFSKN